MNNFELKRALYSVYKKYKSSGFMSDTFIKTIDSFYTQSEPSLFVNRIKGYVKSFDEGKGVVEYKPFIDECRLILNGETNADVKVQSNSFTSDVDHEQKSKPKEEPKSSTIDFWDRWIDGQQTVFDIDDAIKNMIKQSR